MWDRRETFEQTPGDEALQVRLERWCRILGGKDALIRRLASVGKTLSDAESLVGDSASGSATDSLPDWAWVLVELTNRGAANLVSKSNASGLFDGAAAELPFSHVFKNIIDVAFEQFSTSVGKSSDILTPGAVRSVRRQLLSHLCYISSRSIGIYYYEFRLSKSPTSAFLDAWCAGPKTNVLYQSFVDHMSSGGIIELARRYPVWARLICQAVTQWVGATAEFCLSFSDDLPIIHSISGSQSSSPVASIDDIQWALSDRHHDGRGVLVCALSSGRHIVYKPRTLKAEEIFYSFLSHMNEVIPEIEFKIVGVSDRKTHGWMEYIPYEPCRNYAQVDRYFERAGELLCALHVMAVADMHFENIIARGEYPVAVDLEMLFCGERGMTEGVSEVGPIPPLLATGLLPLSQGSGPAGRDISALGSEVSFGSESDGLVWMNVNTDQMFASEAAVTVTAGKHRVIVDDAVCQAADYVQAVMLGFQRAYISILNHRAEISRWLNTLMALDLGFLRVMIRHSSTYGEILEHLLNPKFMEDGIDRSIEIEWLARPLSGSYQIRNGRAELYERERRALERLDIPHLDISSWDSFDLTEDEDFFRYHQVRSASVALDRLGSMSVEDCNAQVFVIKEALEVGRAD